MPMKKAFKVYPIGYFHIDIAEVQTAEGKLYLSVAIDRTRKFAFTELHTKATTRIAADFLHASVKAAPYKIHTVLTDNGIHFTDPKGETWTPAEIRQMITGKEPFRAHAFEYACALTDIDHRLTRPKHPWTNGPGRAHESHHQGRHRQAVPLRRPRPAPQPSRRLRPGLQLCQAPQDPKGPHPVRVHLQVLDFQPEPFTLNPLQQMP
jgi:hypothetical protein